MNDNNHLDHSYNETRREGRRHRRGIGSAVVAAGLVSLGLLLTLDNLGYADAGDFLPYWPVALILVGIGHFLRPAASRRIFAGLVWIGIGVLVLGDNLDYIRFNLGDFWPLILVLIGGSMLLNRFQRSRDVRDTSAGFSATAIMAGDVRRITADDFQGGDATALMGGCEIDLRGAGSNGGPAQIDCFALWGGVEIWVPEDWEVECRGTAILGGFEDKTRTVSGEATKKLIVRGTVIMGGVEIKN